MKLALVYQQSVETRLHLRRPPLESHETPFIDCVHILSEFLTLLKELHNQNEAIVLDLNDLNDPNDLS
jgi:hypothetical protein